MYQLLNLGCGTRTSDIPGVINIDWSPYLRVKRNPILNKLAPFFVTGARRERYNSLPDNIQVHDLGKGIPWPDNSVDAVYHSHLLEHLDQDIAGQFILECKRVLKPGGIMRIVVPDFEKLCRYYLAHVDECKHSPVARAEHNSAIDMLIGHCVRREVVSTRQQPPARRLLENLLLGDARRRGDTHQWMYDRHNLYHLLEQSGFQKITVQQFDTSLIPVWEQYKLDRHNSQEYKPDSLYMEALKAD